MSDAVNQCNLIKRLFVIRMVTELHSKRRALVMKIAKNSAVVHDPGEKRTAAIRSRSERRCVHTVRRGRGYTQNWFKRYQSLTETQSQEAREKANKAILDRS